MSWVKVKQRSWQDKQSVDTVMSVQHIISFNQLSESFLQHGDTEQFADCVCVVKTDQIGEADGSMIVCPSVDEFTRWVRRAEQDGYFDATQTADVKSED